MTRETKKTSTKSDDDFMSKNCDAIAMFSIYGKFGSIRKSNFGRRVYKIYIFINSHLFLLKNLKTEPKNLQRSPYTIALSNGNILSEKRWFFAKKADINKISIFSKKVYFPKQHICLYWRAKSKVPGISK